MYPGNPVPRTTLRPEGSPVRSHSPGSTGSRAPAIRGLVWNRIAPSLSAIRAYATTRSERIT